MDDWEELSRDAPKAAAALPTAKAPRGASSTSAAWALALTPVLYAAVALLEAYGRQSFESPIIAILAVVSIPVGLLLARADERSLRANGYPVTVSARLGAFSPLYLLVRGHRCVSNNFEGLGPAWLHLGCIVLVVASMTILNPWIRAAIYFVGTAQAAR